MRQFLTLLPAIFILAGAGKPPKPTETTFRDPVTHKAGKYLWPAPDDAKAKSQGLMIFFHGSGGGPGYADSYDMIATAAVPYKLTPLLIQAPDGGMTWADPEKGPSFRHREYVESLLSKDIFGPHKSLTRDRVVFAGLSAGSTFLSGDFLPFVLDQYGGGAVLLCGGGGPVIMDPAILGPIPRSTLKKFKIFYQIQTADFLFGQTMTGINYWIARGLAPFQVTPPGGGHCAFDVPKALATGLEMVLGNP